MQGDGVMEKGKGNKRRLRLTALSGMAGLFLASALWLGGCGDDFPDLTDEQVEKAGEYAAMTLLKYDSQNRKRLMSIEDMETEEERREAWRQAAQSVKQQEQEEEKESSQENGSAGGTQTGETASYGNLSDGFVLPEGVTIQYKGSLLCETYPQDSANYFAVVASSGKKNLVLRFLLTNGSEGSQNIDMVDLNSSYQITVNENYTRVSLPTLLENDLANYQGKLMPGASEELVLLIEVDEDVDVSSLKLKLKNDRIESTILLEP